MAATKLAKDVKARKQKRTPPQLLRSLIKTEMDFQGLNQKKLGERIGVSQQTVSNYLCNPGKLDLDTMAKIAKALDFDQSKFREIFPKEVQQ